MFYESLLRMRSELLSDRQPQPCWQPVGLQNQMVIHLINHNRSIVLYCLTKNISACCICWAIESFTVIFISKYNKCLKAGQLQVSILNLLLFYYSRSSCHTMKKVPRLLFHSILFTFRNNEKIARGPFFSILSIILDQPVAQ